MIDSFLVVFPIFALIFLGWLAIRINLVTNETGNGVAEFVFMIAIPLMLFRTLATAPLPTAPPWAYWASYFGGLLLVWLIVAQVSTRLFGRNGQESGIISFAAIQSNMVLMGIPLVLRVFGDEGSVPLFLLVALNLPITLTIATLQIESATPGKSKGMTILRKLGTNPLLIGIVAGGIFRQTGLTLPSPAIATLKLIGDASAPCALFAMGAGLSRYGLGGDFRLLTVLSVLKLLVFPVFVFALGTYVLSVPPLWVGVATVLASCPCGVNAYLLAERYRLAQGVVSGAILVTTILALASTTFWVWLVLGR